LDAIPKPHRTKSRSVPTQVHGKTGIVAGYRLELNPRELGYHVTAFVRVRPIPGHLNKIAELAQTIPEITECHRVTGEECFILKVFFEGNFKLGSRIRQTSGTRANNNVYRAIVACPPEKSTSPVGCLRAEGEMSGNAATWVRGERRTDCPKKSAKS
jgi:hypothetical protein